MDRRTFVGSVASGVLALPLGALAQQQGKVWRVGFRYENSASTNSRYTGALLKGMRDLGYVEDKNLVVEWRFADGKFERLPGLAAELVLLQVDVIVAAGSTGVGAAQKATSTIPIVMATAGDPVVGGFVKSLARPGGNITGLSSMNDDIGAKLLDLLLSVLPKLSRVAVLVSPTSRTYRAIAESVQAGAQKAGVKTLVAEASTPQEIENAFSMMARENTGAVIVGASTFFVLQQRQVAKLALKYRMPSMFGNRVNVEAGGLMSYGQNIADSYQRSATYVDRIFNGAKPGDLLAEQPMSFELVVNMKTAKALGITIPQSLLLRADEVMQ